MSTVSFANELAAPLPLGMTLAPEISTLALGPRPELVPYGDPELVPYGDPLAVKGGGGGCPPG
jgi:hypothetical protein